MTQNLTDNKHLHPPPLHRTQIFFLCITLLTYLLFFSHIVESANKTMNGNYIIETSLCSLSHKLEISHFGCAKIKARAKEGYEQGLSD